ncbi:MAG TPA: hypothetical protein VM695_06160 [Phycisphaerae bacterium]|nr:hypothetical protein [Phycisphaerae bacterium]
MNPSFDNIDLVDHAPAETIGSPELRTSRQHLPDVKGEFFQVGPPGGREVIVRGVLASSPLASAELAAADLKAAVRTRQGRVGQVATYRGSDGAEHAASLLASFRQTGPVRVAPIGSSFQALVPVEARVRTQP